MNTNDPEKAWNCLRFGVTALENKRSVKLFLLGKSVELEELKSNVFDIKGQINLFVKNNGQILACATCLKARGKEGTTICPISTMSNLLKLVEKSDKVLTFG